MNFFLFCLLSVVGLSSAVRVTTSDYAYNAFFDIKEFAAEEGNGTMVLKLYVQGPNDAHVFLTSHAHTDAEDVYEIVIGGWSNSKSVIRDRKQGPHLTEVKTREILSCTEPRAFWVEFAHDGSYVSVREEEAEAPFMQYESRKSFPVRYFSLATWHNTSLKWKI